MSNALRTRRGRLRRGVLVTAVVAAGIASVTGARPDRALAGSGLEGHCKSELAVGRNAGPNLRFRVDGLDPVWSPLLDDGGSGWGESRGVTALAMGDVDGDGDDELAVGRNAGPNLRFEVLDFNAGVWTPILPDGGTEWGDNRGVTALAMGDVDGDGDDELAVGRNAGNNLRFKVLDFELVWAEILPDGGTEWGDNRGVTALAMGDVDGDGDDELAVGRNAGNNLRFKVLDRSDGAWNEILPDGGTEWGDGRGVTALAMSRTGIDRDGDAIPDCWETNGSPGIIDGQGSVGYPGGDPRRRDVFVEIDCLVQPNFGSLPGHSHCPGEDALRAAVQAYADAPVTNIDGTTGIQLHLDVGALLGAGTVVDVAGSGGATGTYGDLGGGNTIPETGNETIDFDGPKGRPATDFKQLKQANFNPARIGYRYAIFGHQTNLRLAANDCTSGWTAGGPDQFLVTLGGTSGSGAPCYATDASGASVGSTEQQAGTLLHELGHVLGRSHGGPERVNYKPNYLSVMNYLFQMCSVPASPVQPGVVGGCDYSTSELPGAGLALDELSLDECAGIDGGTFGFGPMDWDGDGTFSGATCTKPTANVAADINADRFCTAAGPDGNLDSIAAGDDVVKATSITDGPDRTCATAPAGDDTASRSVGDLQVQLLSGAEDWSQLDYSLGSSGPGADGDGGERGSDPEIVARVRHDVGTRLRPRLAVDGPSAPVPVISQTVSVRLAVHNRGGGPAIGAMLDVQGVVLSVGTVSATASREVTVTVPVRTPRCAAEVVLGIGLRALDLTGGEHTDRTEVPIALQQPTGCVAPMPR